MGDPYNQQLITLARRRAFETYLRFGRMPHADAPAAERKAIDPAIPLPGALPQHATRFYLWRSREDDRVRNSHALRHGRVFAWADPPAGGHPGTEPGCRCWAEPYYGDPSIPDALQSLDHKKPSLTAAKRFNRLSMLTAMQSIRSMPVAGKLDMVLLVLLASTLYNLSR